MARFILEFLHARSPTISVTISSRTGISLNDVSLPWEFKNSIIGQATVQMITTLDICLSKIGRYPALPIANGHVHGVSGRKLTSLSAAVYFSAEGLVFDSKVLQEEQQALGFQIQALDPTSITDEATQPHEFINLTRSDLGWINDRDYRQVYQNILNEARALEPASDDGSTENPKITCIPSNKNSSIDMVSNHIEQFCERDLSGNQAADWIDAQVPFRL
ncbi:hypothetical protein BCR34DRAFT_592472 [Clohesyomyces aquaticus]|uniref:Uncharacterized protein n=1 Tax=Clohesyomyces aquaticus TaxID=1231657 RepID=A0A1Y1YRT9_9PLEO|nr:hypothetical protein BCR34DRAFT_592472 [Clohesyomyces aquaticus]